MLELEDEVRLGYLLWRQRGAGHVIPGRATTRVTRKTKLHRAPSIAAFGVATF